MPEHTQDLAPVFICGHHRTGTTLLQSLLDGHPELVVSAGESRFFLDYYPQRDALASVEERLALARRTVLSVWNDENKYYQTYLSHIPCSTMHEAFERHLRASEGGDPQVFEATVLAFGEISGHLSEHTHYWVEKTPLNELYASVISSWWPEARFIHMVRDPRDVYASFVGRAQKKSMKPPSLAGFMVQFERSVHALHRNLKRYGDRYLVVKYESLVTDPEEQLERVRSFLGLTESPVLMRPTKTAGATEWAGNALREPLQGVTSARIGRWRTLLTEGQQRFIEERLNEHMSHWGYEVEDSSLSPAVWVTCKAYGAEKVPRELVQALRN